MSSTDATATLSGSDKGRFLIAKTRRTPASDSMEAPSPQSVSVGYAMTPPSRATRAASSTGSMPSLLGFLLVEGVLEHVAEREARARRLLGREVLHFLV